MLAVLRIFLIGSYLLITTPLLVGLFLVRPFHRNNVHVAARVYGKVALLLGLQIEIRGRERLGEGPYVFIANHQNSYDIFTLSNAVPPGTVSIGKKSLIYIPLFGWVYYLSGNILIDRQRRTKAINTLTKAVEKVKARRISLWLFPEGTRSNGRGLLPFKTGAFHAAAQAQVPVVPVCMSNIHGRIRLNHWRNGRVIIEYLPPQSIDAGEVADIKALARAFHAKMALHISQLDNEIND